jgi:Zn-dependent peptidase ImmA (M78 family)
MTLPAIIQPPLLSWARKTAGYGLEEAAQKLHISSEKLLSAEDGSVSLTFRQLQQAAITYRRPLALFFLPAPPPAEQSVHDFRLGTDVAGQAIAPSVLVEIRRARQRRNEVITLAHDLDSSLKTFVVSALLTEDVEKVAARINEALGLADNRAPRWKSPELAFKGRKAAVENLGVLVFEASRVATEQMRGAALYFEQLPVIILNGADAHVGRSFTLMHELTHLLLRQGGICDLAPADEKTSDAQTERFCNAVAAAALMPAAAILAAIRQRQRHDWTMDELGQVAPLFHTSREALLLRLVTLGLATPQHYRAMRPLFREEFLRFKQTQKSDGGGGPSPAVMAFRNLGRPFVQLVLDAYEADRIDLSTASDYLGVKLRQLPRLRELAAGAVAA